MELYKQYLLERENTHLYYEDDCFITYEFIDNYCYIKEVYVAPDKRRSGKALLLGKMVQDLAREKGMHFVMGSVCISTNGWQKSLAGLYKDGYTFDKSKDDMIYLVKDL